jgi:hypothetical protein
VYLRPGFLNANDVSILLLHTGKEAFAFSGTDAIGI